MVNKCKQKGEERREERVRERRERVREREKGETVAISIYRSARSHT